MSDRTQIFLEEIFPISDLPCEVLDSVSETDLKQPVKRLTESKQFANPIPKSLQFFALPLDINEFITGIYPHLNAYLTSRIFEVSDLQGTIAEFIIYMLEDASDGVPHWKRYDSVKFSKHPYHKWFIANLRYFLLEYKKEEAKKKMYSTLSEVDFESAVEIKQNNAIHLDLISEESNMTVCPTVTIYIDQFLSFVKNFSIAFKKNTDYQPSEKRIIFESVAFEFLQLKLEGHSNKQIAEYYNVSQSAISQWMAKLRMLTLKFNPDSFEGYAV